MTTKTYIIDNGRSYSDHRIFFVEADSAQFEPLWSAYTKAWPPLCLKCGEAITVKCTISRWPDHETPECFSLIAVADDLSWRDTSSKMTLKAWLEWNDCNFDETVSDTAAADEFKRLGKLLLPGFLDWMSGPFELRTYT